ncbi:MAG: phosphoserine phosphatase SerB [Litorilituus sp.]|nr:phosphoserine phosphatase SerB [Litorilituus sp.]
MSFSTNVLPLSLENYFRQNPINQDFPVNFSLNKEKLSLTSDNILPNPPNEPIVELVIFEQTTLAQLQRLQTQAAIEITSLSKVNKRNQQVSYRFIVSCSDFTKARKALANFTLENNIEGALIKDAPKLNEPGLLVMDMDSTTIEIECIDEIAKLAGVGEQVATVTELAMLGELDFSQSLHQRVATLENAPETILAQVAKNIPLMAGLENLITELKKHHWRVAIASGGFTYFADHLKTLLSLDATFANELEIIDGKLTGKVLGSVVDAQVKADSLTLLADQYQFPVSQTVAMGDGANDLMMMAAAGFGVAFHAKPIVLSQADSTINQQGLDCLLHWLA